MLRQMPKTVTIGEAARAIGVSADTLRRWDRGGKLRTTRDERNRRLVRDGRGEGHVRDDRAERMRRAAALAAATLLVLAGCGGGGSSGSGQLTVSAASSLKAAFPTYDAAARYSFAGSDVLAAQI